MDEEELDSSMSLRPFRSEDAVRLEAAATRCTRLGVALWGRNSADLQRQFNAPYPELPSGIDLADLRNLQSISRALINPRSTWLSALAHSESVICVGLQTFTAWEARCEIVRRAITYLEGR